MVIYKTQMEDATDSVYRKVSVYFDMALISRLDMEIDWHLLFIGFGNSGMAYAHAKAGISAVRG